MTTEHQDKRHKETDTTTTKENPTENLCWWCNPTIRFSFFLVLFTGALVVVGFLTVVVVLGRVVIGVRGSSGRKTVVVVTT